MLAFHKINANDQLNECLQIVQVEIPFSAN